MYSLSELPDDTVTGEPQLWPKFVERYTTLRKLPLPPSVRVGAALVLVGVGACFDVAGLLAFRKAKTTVNPLAPNRSTAVVSTGVYRITRNPMYLGMALILLGLALYLASPWALLGPLVFAAFITRFQIQPEERALTARFGAAYTAYCTQVRRWL